MVRCQVEILLHRDPETKGSLYFQVACEEEKHLIIIQLLNPLRFPLPLLLPAIWLSVSFFFFQKRSQGMLREVSQAWQWGSWGRGRWYLR